MTTSSDSAARHPDAASRVTVSRGPWATAVGRILRQPSAIIALVVLALIIAATAAAPIYAEYVSRTNPFATALSAKIWLDGQEVLVIQPVTEGLGLGTIPIGPTWGPQYFAGSDSLGRDVMARILYGGQNSLFIAGIATTISLVFALLVGLCAGFFGGIVDTVLTRLLDVVWAFPVFLLATSLSVVTIGRSFDFGLFEIRADSIIIPVLIIGIVNIPYIARPVRAQTIQVRQSEFVTAARGIGVPSWRILLIDVVPNVLPILIVFAPITVAISMILESSLSFLSIGVQAPESSWGTIIRENQPLLYSRPWTTLAPGLAIVLTVVMLNLLGDVVRDAFDPRMKQEG